MLKAPIRLAIIITHPIQYYVPVFKLLAQSIELKVFYTAGRKISYDKGFQQDIQWDIPLFEGYDYEFLNNISKHPQYFDFMSIINPDAVKEIMAFLPQQILIYGWAYYSHLKILHAFNRKATIIFRGDSNLLKQDNKFKGIVKRLILTNIYGHINKALYVGINNRKYFKKYGLREEQLIFAPHAVDIERFGEAPVNFIRQKIGLDRTDILVLYAGKFTPEKNLKLLLTAFAELELSQAYLLLVGGGILEKELKKLSKGHIYTRMHIHFMPFQNQTVMPSIYMACDLFCLPSKSESWGLAVNEAMAAGKPVLVSDMVGAAPDLVKNTNGMIFKSNDLDDLKKKLRILTSSQSDLVLKGQSSKTIINSWNFKTQANNILSALQS